MIYQTNNIILIYSKLNLKFIWNDNNKIIVFSQWNNMSSFISKYLSENGFGYSVIKR